MSGGERVVLQELKPRTGTTAEIASYTGVRDADVLAQVRDLNDRLRSQFRFDSDPIDVTSAGTWRVDGVAGLMRLNDEVELEVVPKFLDPDGPWRLDFFVLAVLVKTGHLLAHDEISASVTDRDALGTLIARSLLRMHEENERRPIRSYRRTSSADFAVDGDVDWESLSFPDPEGFRVSRVELTRRNSFNATLAAALKVLVPEVTDADTQAQLQFRARGLRPQAHHPKAFPPLPPRHSGWETAYELSQLVASGIGIDLTRGRFSGPGFVLSTWEAWEQLCEHVVDRALPDWRVHPQRAWKLGERGGSTVNVRPDITVEANQSPELLLDAKYKTRLGKKSTIASSDLYESLAFMRATAVDRMILLFPSQRPTTELSTGEWRRFDEVRVDYSLVQGVEIQLQGLAAPNGFDRLVAGARAALVDEPSSGGPTA